MRINCISPGQIDVGVDLQNVCIRWTAALVEILIVDSLTCGE